MGGGLCQTSNFSIFTFVNAGDLNFAHVLTAAVYISWWGSKVRMEKFEKWWRHTLELYCFLGLLPICHPANSPKLCNPMFAHAES